MHALSLLDPNAGLRADGRHAGQPRKSGGGACRCWQQQVLLKVLRCDSTACRKKVATAMAAMAIMDTTTKALLSCSSQFGSLELAAR